MLSTEKEFFGNEFVGLPISFSDPESHWILTEKLREHYSQLIPEEVLEYPDARSEAYGTFLAKNLNDANQESVIRIIMQVPYAGGEVASSQERARQAVQTLPSTGQDMLDALTLLEREQCRSAPRLLGITRKTQTDTDPVPGGFFTFLLLEKLPGRQMGPWFWEELDRDQRDIIRVRFKDAWMECTRVSGYHPPSSPSKTFWDANTQRIAFYNFLTGDKEDGVIPWKDVYFILWGLAKPPPKTYWWGEQPEHSDMTGWKL